MPLGTGESFACPRQSELKNSSTDSNTRPIAPARVATGTMWAAVCRRTADSSIWTTSDKLPRSGRPAARGSKQPDSRLTSHIWTTSEGSAAYGCSPVEARRGARLALGTCAERHVAVPNRGATLLKESQMLTDVLIVGAGPTGLMLANQLARRGLRPTIIDRHSGPAQQTRAMAVHARTLEIYRKLGIAERAIELGRPGNGANMWSQGRLKARIPFKDMGKGLSAFPYVLMLGQDDNERIMGDHLRRWNIEVRWNTELIALTQDSNHVTATIKTPDGTTATIDAAYVAGCD